MKNSGEKTHTDIVREQLLSQRKQDITNKETGIKASFGVKGINKMLSNTAINKSIRNGFTRDEHLDAAADIKSLFENAKLYQVTGDDQNKSASLKSVKRFISDMDKNKFAYITVKESIVNGHRIYSLELQEIDKAPLDKGKPYSSTYSNDAYTTLIISQKESTSKENYLKYKVGGLLYMPALQENIVAKIKEKSIPCLTSAALCLEDAILDESLTAAEAELKHILNELLSVYEKSAPDNPLLFVRVRSPKHLLHVANFLGDTQKALTGYILPKFDLGNADAYLKAVKDVNSLTDAPVYIMPVLESVMLAKVAKRGLVLEELKNMLDGFKNFVLNIRVGGNDFSNLYGLRRPVNSTIYDVGIVRDILMDILNVFAADYTVSGPVWEFFGENKEGSWAKGLERELNLDRINGFIGKTAIHPSQLPLIYDSLRVSKADYEDAVQILNWKDDKLGVVKSVAGNRMNEVKTHGRWAEQIKILGDIYGIKD